MGAFFEAWLWPLAVAPVSITWRLGSSPRCPSHLSPAPATADGVEACLSTLKCQSAPSHRPAAGRRAAMGKVFRERCRRKKLISGGRLGPFAARPDAASEPLARRTEVRNLINWRLQGNGKSEWRCVKFVFRIFLLVKHTAHKYCNKGVYSEYYKSTRCRGGQNFTHWPFKMFCRVVSPLSKVLAPKKTPTKLNKAKRKHS